MQPLAEALPPRCRSKRSRRRSTAGGFPIKRIVGDEVVVEADVFADGHEELVALLQHRHESEDNLARAADGSRWATIAGGQRFAGRTSAAISIALSAGSIGSALGGTI